MKKYLFFSSGENSSCSTPKMVVMLPTIRMKTFNMVLEIRKIALPNWEDGGKGRVEQVDVFPSTTWWLEN